MKPRARRVVLAALAIGALLALGAFALRSFGTGRIQAQLVEQLAAWFGVDVTLDSLEWTLNPGLGLVGHGLVVGTSVGDTPPMIRIASFAVGASFDQLTAEPRKVGRVELEGLEVHIARNGGATSAHSGDRAGIALFVIDEVLATNAKVTIASKDPAKLPRIYEIPRLRLTPVDPTTSMSYEALVLNPQPRGEVEATGAFGPWDRESPQRTPISGSYAFRDADMSTIKGLSGTLQSQGAFDGSVAEMDVIGRASIPDFALTIGDVVPLDVDFEVRVGDKGGDIRLETIEVDLPSGHISASGHVSRTVDKSGRLIFLDVTGNPARVEELVSFAVRADEPPIAGAMTFETVLTIPPGEESVVDRMGANGKFAIAEARFSNLDVQKTLAKVSQVTGGEVEASEGEDVVSDLQGAFEIKDAAIAFERLTFEVPGMQVALVGTYGLRDGVVDMRGQVQTERTASEMAPDALSKWLQILDPVLGTGEKGGMAVPISIQGPRNKLSFKPDWQGMTDGWKARLERMLAPKK